MNRAANSLGRISKRALVQSSSGLAVACVLFCFVAAGCPERTGEGRQCTTDVQCNDNNLFTIDSCSATGICRNTALDEDGDGFGTHWGGGTDCNDGDPTINPASVENCADEIDNDCDAHYDCDDPDCNGLAGCHGNPLRENCSNAVDDDGDLLVDCDDPECMDEPHCCNPQREDCSDGTDNDCDMLIDCDDPDCSQDASCCTPSVEDCSDWVDNDCDLFVDCLDPDCATDVACTCLPEQCNDQLDNDCDGLVDCADPDCQGAVHCGGEACMPVPVLTLGCGIIVNGSTFADATSLVQNYSCGGPPLGGLEKIYALQASPGQWGNRPMLVTITLESLQHDYDLLVLHGAATTDPTQVCDPGQCVASSRNPLTAFETASFVAQSDHTYFVAVDSESLQQDHFDLTVSCLALCFPEVCDDGWDNDCDGLSDCYDSECAGTVWCP